MSRFSNFLDAVSEVIHIIKEVHAMVIEIVQDIRERRSEEGKEKY